MVTSAEPATIVRVSDDTPPTVLAKLFEHRLVGVAVVGVISLAVLFLNLGGPSLWDPDEGRHAEVAREMLASGNWLIPTFDFEPYSHKPVLFYWLAALSMRAFGVGAFAARLPSAASALCCVLATMWWGRRFLDPLTGTLAALILATAGMFVVLGRYVVLDMTFTWWLSAAFFYSSAWCFAGRERGWPLWPFYAALGLGMLTKGPAAPVLAVLVWFAFLWRTGGLSEWRGFRPLHGALVLLAVGGSWYVAAAIASPSYIWHFLWVENVERFTTAKVGHAWLGHLAFFYLLPALFSPWSAYIPAAVAHAWNPGTRPSPAREFCLWWLVVIFGFFTASAAKLGTYILPVFPPLALLIADALHGAFRRQSLSRAEEVCHRIASGLFVVLLFAAPVAVLVALALAMPHHLALALVPLPAWVPAWFGVRALRVRRYDLTCLCMLGGTLVLVLGAYAVILPALDDTLSLRQPAQLIRTLPSESRVMALGTIFNSLVFYSERKVTVVRFGEAAAALAASEPAALLTKEQRLDRLRCGLHGDAFIWWRGDVNKLLIVNRRPPPGEPVESLTPLPAAACQEQRRDTASVRRTRPTDYARRAITK
jgi:4-amino-4-deoxy-L-arabinose transferase-like glycosyltransferase